MKALDRLLWFLLSLIAIAYVLVAVYASTGRYFFPKLPEYQDDIVAYLERKTGFDWEIEGLEGSWQKFDPIIRGKKIRIVDKDQDSVFYLTDFMLRLDALASLRYREPRITDFKAGEIQLLLEHTAEGQWIIKNVPTRHSDQQISLEDFVSHFRAIGLEDVDIRVLYRGEVVDMPSVKLAFQRFGDHRRVHFEQSSEQAGDLHLIVESEHSFWDHQGALSIYAKARDLSVNQWLAVFTDDWRLNQVTGEWWIRREPEQSRWSGTALIDDSTLGKGDSDEWLLKNGSVQLAAEQSYDGDLRLWWHELAGVWREQALDMPEGYIDTRVEQG
ncbi:hypothetical protein GYB62_01725, partial [bacterium]|nr:hypothetical protein [bacterium]